MSVTTAVISESTSGSAAFMVEYTPDGELEHKLNGAVLALGYVPDDALEHGSIEGSVALALEHTSDGGWEKSTETPELVEESV